MPAGWEVGAAVYLAGVVWGLLAIDARPLTKVGLAFLWPVGPAAFVVTIATLLAVLPIAFPKSGIALVVLAAVLWWVITRPF